MSDLISNTEYSNFPSLPSPLSHEIKRKRGRPGRPPSAKRALDLKPNLNGRPAITNSWADPGARAKVIASTYQPNQILSLAEDILAKKEVPLSSGDAMIVVHLANIFKADGLERERLYDRTFGKVPDRSLSMNINIDADPDKLSDKALDLLERLQG